MAWIAYGPLRGWHGGDTDSDAMTNDSQEETRQDATLHSCPYGIAACRGECNDGKQPSQRKPAKIRPFGELDMIIRAPKKLHSTLQPPRLDPAADSSFLRNLHFDRHQLIESFLSVLLPRNASQRHPGVSMFSRELMESSGSQMQAAADALCFTLLGTVFKSQWLVHWARQRHQDALSNLEGKLQGQSDQDNAETAGALYLLGYCSGFKALPVSAKHRRIHHQTFLKCASTLDASNSRMAKLLVGLAQHMVIMYAPVERKGFMRGFDNSARRAVASSSMEANSYTDRLALLCLDMSNLLERVESANHEQDVTHDGLMALITDTSALGISLKSWFHEWAAMVGDSPWHTVSIDTFPHFPAVGNAFSEFLHFRRFSECNILLTYWIALLSIDAAQMDLLSHPQASHLNADAGLLLEADSCAEKLCQSIPWLTLEGHGFGRLFRSNAIVYSASAWFRRTAQPSRLHWCGHVWKWIEEQGGIYSYCEL